MEAYKLEREAPGSVAFLDLSDRDFDVEQTISASSVDGQLWRKILELSVGTLGKFIGPSVVYLCEGDPNANQVNRSFDAQVLTRIFGSANPQVAFVSVGNSDAVRDKASVTANSVKSIFPDSEIRRFIDRDDRSQEEVDELLRDGVRVSTLRHIEAYLLSDEAIRLLCESVKQVDRSDAAVEAKRQILEDQVSRGKSADDIKWASRNIRVELSKLLTLKNAGSTGTAFLRDTMAPLLRPGGATYELLKADLGLNT